MKSLELKDVQKPMCLRGKQNSSQTYKDTERRLSKERVKDCPEFESRNSADAENHGNAARFKMIGNRRLFKYASDTPVIRKGNRVHPPRPPPKEQDLNHGQRQNMATDTESFKKDSHMQYFHAARKKERDKLYSTGPHTVLIRQRTGRETPEFVEKCEIYDIKRKLPTRDLWKKCPEDKHVSDKSKEEMELFQEHKFKHGQQRHMVSLKEPIGNGVDSRNMHHYRTAKRKALHGPIPERPKTAPIHQRKNADPSDRNNFDEEFDKLLVDMPSTATFDNQQDKSESTEERKKYNVKEQLFKRRMIINGQRNRQLTSDEHKEQKKNVQDAHTRDIFIEDLEQTGMSPQLLPGSREKQNPSSEHKDGFDLGDFQDGHEENVHHQFKECSRKKSLNSEINGNFHQQSEYISTVSSSESMDISNDNEGNIHGAEICIEDNTIATDDQDRDGGIDTRSTTLGISDVHIKTPDRQQRLHNQEEKTIDDRQSDDKSNVTVKVLNILMPTLEDQEELSRKELKTTKRRSSDDVQKQDNSKLSGRESESEVSGICTSINAKTMSENQTDIGNQAKKNSQDEVTKGNPEVYLHMDRDTLNISTTIEAKEGNKCEQEQHIHVNRTNMNDDDDDLDTAAPNQKEFSWCSLLHDKPTMDTLTVISTTKKDASNLSSSDERDMMDTLTPILPNQNNASNSQLSDGKDYNDSPTQINVNKRDISNSPPSDDYDKMHSQKSHQNNASNCQSVVCKNKMDTPKQMNLNKTDASYSPLSTGKDMMENPKLSIPNQNNFSNQQSCEDEFDIGTPSKIHVNKTNATNSTSYDDRDIIDAPTPVHPKQNDTFSRRLSDDKDKRDTETQFPPIQNNALNDETRDVKDKMDTEMQFPSNQNNALNDQACDGKDKLDTETQLPQNQNNALNGHTRDEKDKMDIKMQFPANQNYALNDQTLDGKDKMDIEMQIPSNQNNALSDQTCDGKDEMDTFTHIPSNQNNVSNCPSCDCKDTMHIQTQLDVVNKAGALNLSSDTIDAPTVNPSNQNNFPNHLVSVNKDGMHTTKSNLPNENRVSNCQIIHNHDTVNSSKIENPNSLMSDNDVTMDTPRPNVQNQNVVSNSSSPYDNDKMDTSNPKHTNKAGVFKSPSSDDKVMIETTTPVPQNQTNASNSQAFDAKMDSATIINHSNNNNDSSKRAQSDTKGEMHTTKQNLVNKNNASNSQSSNRKDKMDSQTVTISNRNDSSKLPVSNPNLQNQKGGLNSQSPLDKDKTDFPKTIHLNKTIIHSGLSSDEQDGIDTSLPHLPGQDDTSNSLVSDNTVFTQNITKPITNSISNNSLLDDKHSATSSKIITPHISKTSHNLQEKHEKDIVESTNSNEHDSSNSLSPCTERTSNTQTAIYNATNKTSSRGITNETAKETHAQESESSSNSTELKKREPMPSSNTKLQKKQEANDRRNHSINRTERPIRGIPNVGNTCFANSVLQVLGQTPELTTRLKSVIRTKHLTKSNSITEWLLWLIQQINQGSQQSGRGISTNEVKKLLKRIFSRDNSFSLGRQNDSHSFMLTLFEALLEEEGHDAVELFEGYSRNIFKYDCGHEDPAERERFISILIPAISTNRTLTKGLEVILEERFDESVLRCRTCKQEKPATRVLTFEKLPKILVIQLGAFKQITQYGKTTLEKDNGTIIYKDPLTLRLASNKPVTYHLYGIVSHSGSLRGGHYTADVKCQSQWYHCSDGFVKESENRANKFDKGALLLFYSQRPTTPTAC